MMNRRSLCIAASASLALGATRLGAQTSAATRNWPEKPLHFVTPYPPGGLSDQITRYVGDRMARALGKPVIVENKPGAGALLGTEYAAHMPNDGYNFFVAPTATVCVSASDGKENHITKLVPFMKCPTHYSAIKGTAVGTLMAPRRPAKELTGEPPK